MKTSKELLLEFQENTCAICTVSLTLETGRLDHNHNTGLVRGVLCVSCNVKEGQSTYCDHELFIAYRSNPPATQLGLIATYSPSSQPTTRLSPAHSGPKRTPASETKTAVIRFPPDVYNAISSAASLSGTSLNNLVIETLRNNFVVSSTGTNSVDVLNAARSVYAATLSAPVTSVTPTYDQTITTWSAAQEAIDKLSGKKDS